MSWQTRLYRATRRVLLGLVGIGLALVLVLLFALGTRVGRNFVLSQVLPHINDSIPGRLQVRDFSRLSLGEVEILGIAVFDPGGKQVLALDRLRVKANLLSLRAQALRVKRLELHRGFVDIRDIAEERSGLVAAFVDPESPPSPPSPTPLPYVQVESIVVDGLRIVLPRRTPLAPTEIRNATLRGRFELDRKPRATIESLTLEAVRGSEPIARLTGLRGTLGRGAEASSVELSADLSGVAVRVTAQAVLPPAQNYTSAPLRASLRVVGVTSARIARLTRDESLKGAFEGEVSLDGAISGSLDQLEARLHVSSAGGPANLTAGLRSLSQLRLELDTPGFNPARAIAAAPDLTVAGQLSAAADIARAPEFVRMHSLNLRGATLNGEQLPHVDASAVLDGQSVTELRLDLADEHSRIRVAGKADFDGSAALEVVARVEAPTVRRLALLAGQKQRFDGMLSADLAVGRTSAGALNVAGEVSGRALAFGEHSLRRLDANVALEGQPSDLAGTVKLELRGLKAGSVQVHGATLDVHGGPKNFAVNLRGRSNQGDLDLVAAITHEDPEIVLEAKAKAKRQGHALGIEVLATRLDPDAGSVHTPGVMLTFGEQTLSVRGNATRDQVALDLEATAVDLSTFNPLLPNKAQLQGTVTLAAEARGSIRQPRIVLDLDGQQLRVGERPALDVELNGYFDAAQGKSSVNLRMRDHAQPKARQRLVVSLNAESRFATTEPPIQAIRSAEHRARLDLETLDLGFVKSMLPEMVLPVDGHVRAGLQFQGSWASPRLALEARADLEPAWTKRSLHLSQELLLQSEHLDLELTVDDPDGNWIDLTATASLPPLEELMRNPQQLARSQRWRLRTQLAERQLSQLPIPPDQLRALPTTTLSGSLDAQHEPGREPDLDLRLVLLQKEAIEARPGCKTEGLSIETKLSLSRGQMGLEVLGRQADRELVDLDARANVGLMGALSGEKPEIGPISATLRSRNLELRSLPFVCERFGGRVDLHASVEDPLGPRPNARLNVQILGLTAGSRVSVDTELDVLLEPHLARLDAEVRHGIHTSTAVARIPVVFGGGRLRVDNDAAARGRLRLRHLPIEPFLDPQGAISYATGTLSGEAKLSGTLKRPRLAGVIELEKLGFTATDMAQPLHNIQGRIKLTQSRVQLAGLQAEDKDGTLRLDGELDLVDTGRVRGNFRLRASKFPLRQRGQVVATTDVDARIRSTVTPDTTQVRVNLERVDTWLESAELRRGIDLDGHPDVIVDGVPAVAPEETKNGHKIGGRPLEKASASRPAGRPTKANGANAKGRMTEIVLDARDKFWVKRNDFAVKLAALLTARIHGGQVQVEGTVKIDRGYLSLFGKVFEIQRGSDLKFIGSPQPNPVLSIEAVHENRRSGNHVKVHITGRGSAPELAFFVDDAAVTAGDAFVALFGAQRSNEDPDGAGDQARDFVGGLTAGILATTARRELGAAAPVIMVDPGSGKETRVRAGFELDSLVPRFLHPIVTGLYFEGIVANDQDANTQDANVHGGALLEIYFPRDFFATGQYGPGSTWSVDLGWQL